LEKTLEIVWLGSGLLRLVEVENKLEERKKIGREVED
jgi:hypothetical protein